MSWWNPVDDVKSAVKDAKHVVSDTLHTGEKLADDAYKTVKDGVKGAVKTGVDAVKTGITVGSDLAQGHFKDAITDGAKGVWHVGGDIVHTEGQLLSDEAHGVVDLSKGVVKVGGDLNKFAIDSLSAVNPLLGDTLRVGEVFAESAINTGILQPLDGASQLLSAGVHELTGYKLPSLELHITPDTQGLGIVGRIAADAGDAAGFIAPLLVTGGATSALAGLSVGADALDAADVAGTVGSAVEDGATAARGLDAADEGVTAASRAAKVAKFVDSPYKTAVDGAIAGFVFTPSNGKGNILESRFEAAGVNAITFGSMSGVSRVLSSEADGLLASTDNAAIKTATHLGANAASGVVGGVANAESSSLLSGKGFASAHDVTHDAALFAVTGTAMAGAHFASQKGFEVGANLNSNSGTPNVQESPAPTPATPVEAKPLTTATSAEVSFEPPASDSPGAETAKPSDTASAKPSDTASGETTPVISAPDAQSYEAAMKGRTRVDDPETGTYKISGADGVTVSYDKDNNVTNVWNEQDNHGLRPIYETDEDSGKPQIQRIESYSINPQLGNETITPWKNFTPGNGGWYHGDTPGDPYVPVGRNLSIGPDGVVSIKGQVTTPDGIESFIGRGSHPVESVEYNPQNGYTYHLQDGGSVARDFNDKVTKIVSPSGESSEFTYEMREVTSAKIGGQTYDRGDDGIFHDSQGKPFARSINAEGTGVTIYPTEDARSPTAADKPIARIELNGDSSEALTYSDGTYESPTFKVGDDNAQLQFTNHELTKVTLDQKSYVKHDGIFYDEATGQPFAKDITLTPHMLSIEPVDGLRLPVPGEPNGKEVSKINEYSYGSTSIEFKGDPPAYRYDLSRSPQESAAHQTFVTDISDNSSSPKAKYTIDGQKHKISQDAGGVYVDKGPDGTKPLEVSGKPVVRVTPNSDGSVTQWNADHEAVRIDADGTEVNIDSNLHETINGDKYLGSERNKLNSSITRLMPPEQAHEFRTQMNTFESRLTARFSGGGGEPPTPEQSTELNDQLANTYYQLNKMLTADPSAISLDNRITLARQFAAEAADPILVGQGNNPTCNVTAGVQNRDFTNNPAQAAQTVANIATRGGFVTGDGHVVDMTSMPGALAPAGESLKTVGFNAPVSINGERNYLSQLYQTSAVDAYWQSSTTGPDGVPSIDASTISELRDGQDYHAGSVRYGLDPHGGNALIDTTEQPAKVYMNNQQFNRVDPFTGKETVSSEKEAINAPDLSDEQIIQAGRLLSNDTSTHYIKAVGKWDSTYERGGVVSVNSPEKLQDTLLEMKEKGALPAVVRVDTRNPIFTGLDAADPNASGGAHVINVQDIRETAPGSGKYVIDATNQWGAHRNYMGDNAITPEQLHEAMQEYSPQVRSVPQPQPYSPFSQPAMNEDPWGWPGSDGWGTPAGDTPGMDTSARGKMKSLFGKLRNV